MRTILKCFLYLLLSSVYLLLPTVAFAQKTPILFQKVRVFDGTKVIAETDVLIQDGKIKEMGPDLVAGEAEVVDGAGKTLLPGLIDAHVHVHGAETLEQALVFGVTTEFDMMMQPRMEYLLKSQENDRMASFLSAGFPATVPGGHGTEYGIPIPTLNKPSEAKSFVEERLREGSDYIKIMYTEGAPGGRNLFPSINKETMAAVIAAAHANHRMA